MSRLVFRKRSGEPVPLSSPPGVSIRDRERSPLQILRNVQIRALNLNREMEMLEAGRLLQIESDILFYLFQTFII
jgi:hypothetical protein